LNSLSFTLYAPDLDSTTVLATNLSFQQVSLGSQLHGGFGEFHGRLRLRTHDAYHWYRDHHNARLLVHSAWNQHTVWEGRLEDITLLPGYGVEITAFGYWRNCFDQPFQDEDTWADGDYRADQIIKTLLERYCPQINNQSDYLNVASSGRIVSPFKVTSYRYPNDVIRELLEGGDEQGTSLYFAVWEDRLPTLFAKTTTVDWVVRLQDCHPPPEMARSIADCANTIIAEYSVEGQAGDVNDSGTASGERAHNYVTLTDSSQGWDPGQWNSGFDVALTAGSGQGQIRDILDTRQEPEVVDSGQCDDYDYGVSDSGLSAWSLETALEDKGKGWQNNQWKDEENPYYVEITSGTCVGQSRQITANDPDTLQVSPAWEADAGKYPSSDGGSTYHIYRPSQMQDKDKSWAQDAYNNGYMVEIVHGRGASQRRLITDTAAVVVGQQYGQYGQPIAGTGTSFHVLSIEPNWETAPDHTSRYEIHRVAAVVAAGTATGGSHNTLEDSSKTWSDDQYNDDYEVAITKGACANQVARIVDTQEHTLTVQPLWDNDIPDSTSQYEIRLIQEKESEASAEGHCTQLLLTTPWSTPPDATSSYEIRQKREGGTLQRTATKSSTRSMRDLGLSRKRVLSLGVTTPGEAERIAARALALLRDPQAAARSFAVSRIANPAGVEMPLPCLRAGHVLEISDLFAGQDETADLDALRRFYIIRTSYDQERQMLTVTPDTVETDIATLIASTRR